jgi:hypothetical protein
MHHDVRSRDLITTEELTRGLGKIIFKKFAVLLQLRIDEG